jgi:hypothetical protein
MRRSTIWIAAVALATMFGGEADAVQGPMPPCGVTPNPDYAAPGAPPTIKLWHADEIDASWQPQACIPWASGTFSLMVTLAGQFDSTADVDSLLDRIGAISTLTDTRYWSVTDRAWKSLFERATALTGPTSDQPRRDFTAAELRDGHDHYFLEKDNRLGAAVIERLTVLAAADDRIVFETVNVTPMKFLLVTVYPPGAFHTIYFLSRRTAAQWNFYSLQYAGSDRSLLTALVPQDSYINRANALFRHLAGIPTDREPPAAP